MNVAFSSESELDPVGPGTGTSHDVEAYLGQQPDGSSVVGARLGKHGARSQPRISSNLVQRRPERLTLSRTSYVVPCLGRMAATA